MKVKSRVSTVATRLAAALVLLAATMLGTAKAADEIVFFHVNAVGSATAAFNEDGDLCWAQDYTPYGRQLRNDDASPVVGCGLIGKDRGFTGHVQDESGLTYMQQRYYDASIGRFLSVDPVGVSAGNTNTYNRYMYGNNNPYKFIDPDGGIAIFALVPLVLKAIDVAITAAEVTAAAQSGGATAVAGVALESAATSVVPGGKLASKVAGAVVGGGKKTGGGNNADDFVDLTTAARRKHILDGDATGGGHRPGTGKPGKSEFPSNRSDDSIIHDISDIATDPSLKSRSGRGGRTITDGTRNGVDIRVVQERNGDIVTGFPTNTPRNPK